MFPFWEVFRPKIASDFWPSKREHRSAKNREAIFGAKSRHFGAILGQNPSDFGGILVPSTRPTPSAPRARWVVRGWSVLPIGRTGRVDEETARLSAAPLLVFHFGYRRARLRRGRRDSPAFGGLVRGFGGSWYKEPN